MDKAQRTERFKDCIGKLRKQRERSSEDGKCKYRGPDGLKCAVGMYIPDEFYNEEMEGLRFSRLIKEFSQLEDVLQIENAKDIAFYRRLQEIHDRDLLFVCNLDSLRDATNFMVISGLIEEVNLWELLQDWLFSGNCLLGVARCSLFLQGFGW